MDVDAAFRHVGEFGSYQKRVVFVVAISSSFLLAMGMVINIFVVAIPHQVCAIKEHGTDTMVPICTQAKSGSSSTSNNSVQHCIMCERCEKIVFQDDLTSIVSELNLSCGEMYKTGLVQSFLMFGVLCGAVVFGRMSDRLGRLKCIYFIMTGLIALGFVCAFSTSFNMLMSLKFCHGVFLGGCGVVVYVYLGELVGSTYMTLVGSLVSAFFAVGVMVLSLSGYIVRQWRYLSMWTSLPYLVFAVFYWYLPESPRWLYSKGRTKEAETVLEFIAKKNGQPRNRINLKTLKEVGSSQSSANSILVLLTEPLLRWRTIAQAYSWFTNCVVYYGLTLGSGSLGSNRYIALALSGLVELPSNFCAYFLLDRLGRKPCICGAMMIGGVSCIAIAFLDPANTGVKTALALSGKMLISSSFMAIYIHSAELHPTVVRNLGMGFMSMMARVGGILAPMVITLDSLYPSLSFIVFGALGVTGSLVNMSLPETLNKPMPETIEDLRPNGQYVPEKVLMLNSDTDAEI